MILYMLAVFSYLIGSIPFALIAGRLKGNLDIRKHGSGNMGTTNAFRVLGKRAGLAVAVLDISKGFLPVWIATTMDTHWHPIVFGVLAVLGHTYPVFAQFKGGKAVATTGGMLLALDPLLFAKGVGIFAICLLVCRMVSLSSMLTASALAWLSYYEKDPVLFGVMLVIAGFIIWRHKSNIQKIIRNEEPKIGRKGGGNMKKGKKQPVAVHTPAKKKKKINWVKIFIFAMIGFLIASSILPFFL